MIARNGISRRVIFLFGLAFKVPSWTSWRNFLWGLLANMQERQMYGCKELRDSGKLCPIYFSLPCGFLIVMPRVQILKEGEVCRERLVDFCHANENWTVPAEPKCNSFGYLNGRMVAVDYG